jgi:hypothetical protein
LLPLKAVTHRVIKKKLVELNIDALKI